MPATNNIEDDPKADCGFGHACHFCSKQDSCRLDQSLHNKTVIEARLAEIGQIIIVLANKGGVGKSTIAANLSAGLAQRGFRVGVADADIHGPNQSRFFGFSGDRIRLGDDGLEPRIFRHEPLDHGIRIGSLAFLLQEDDSPIIWRDPYKHDFIHHLIGSFDWGALDYLIVDMPPGTGNELITLSDLLEGANVSAVLVTTSQAVAMMDSMKALRFCHERGLPVVGAVHNMAGVVCPHCQGDFHVFPDGDLTAALQNLKTKILTRIPLDPRLASCSDTGSPLVVVEPDSIAAKAFLPLVEACVAVGAAGFKRSVSQALGDVFDENLRSETLNAALHSLDEEARANLGEAIADMLDAESQRLQLRGET